VSSPSIASSILETIGHTPLVALDRLAAGLASCVLAKVEFYSPGGSVKDRAALAVIEAAEREGRLGPGGTVVELTSGNMGIGLAVVCAVRGYRMIAVMSEGNSPERRRMLRALGAEVELVPQAGGSRPGQVSKEDLELEELRTQELVKERHAFRPDQFRNPNGVRAHELTTGAEIWVQTGGKVTVFAAAVGTAGTFTGIARALKKRNTVVRFYAVEPASAAFLAGRPVVSTSHKLQGVGYAMALPVYQPELCDGYLTATDDEAVWAARTLATREGILAGFSSGANVAAALRLARELPAGNMIVTILPDTGLKYLSTDLLPE
jgi:cysteine synthase A